MSAGCAIVGSNADAIGEIIEDGVNGLLVNPANAGELSTALKYLADRAELRKELGAAAKVKVETQLEPEVELNNWLGIYQGLLDASNNEISHLKVV
jgi:glycosyltransferase involved in cell wall biosynthesis